MTSCETTISLLLIYAPGVREENHPHDDVSPSMTVVFNQCAAKLFQFLITLAYKYYLWNERGILTWEHLCHSENTLNGTHGCICIVMELLLELFHLYNLRGAHYEQSHLYHFTLPVRTISTGKSDEA